MWTLLPLPLLFLTFALLIRAEERAPKDERQIWIWKPLSTCLIILTCVLSFTSDAYDAPYTLLVAAGLTFSLAGDVLLIPPDNPKAFLGGLVAFLLAHGVYITAFVYLQISLELERNFGGEIIAAVMLALVGAAVYAYLRPGLGAMRGPVIAYIVVISAMVHRALAVALAYTGSATQPALIVLGALLFYLSDAILAINKFRLQGRMPHYRLWNLSTYYSGQLLIALSASFFA
jgi:uncharacterized membrane protein YhhN